jgi:3-oxoadipate enol-lactonase
VFPLEFDDQGEGEAVVLLPPFPFDRRVWGANGPALVAAGFRVVAVDYPGFGASRPALPGDVTIATIASSTAALLDRLGIARATLVGLSMGGYVALAFAAGFAERLGALVLADTRAAADAPAARQGRAQALETLATRGVDAYLQQSLPRLLAPTASPALLATTRALAEERQDALAAGIVALRDRPDRTADARRITCPTLLLVGTADQVTPAAEMRALAEIIPGANVVEIPEAGHLTNHEAPEAFNRHVVTFLRGLPRLASAKESRGAGAS